MIGRKIDWAESTSSSYNSRLDELEKALVGFYAGNGDYYTDIDFTVNNWSDPQERAYAEIISCAERAASICEIGCGKANILRHVPQLEASYTGCDFSPSLVEINRRTFPRATFASIVSPNVFPFPDQSFDFVFSVFVLEHSTRPARFLDECARILEPGGTMVILCPDFLENGQMASQRAGWTCGTAKQKLKKGRLLDAVVTFYDNRVRIPWHCRRYARQAAVQPLFLVNLSPVVFEDPFTPDVDAVYVTCKREIVRYLEGRFHIDSNPEAMVEYERERRLIFLSMNKK